MDKQEFLWKDRYVKGISLDQTIKVTVVKTTDVVELARTKHELSPISTVVLGRALTGASLLASQLKGEERVRLSIHGNGPIGSVTAEANYVGEIRGFVQNPQTLIDWTEETSFEDVVGKGSLQLSKMLYNEAKPITGIVELVDGSITADIAHYLDQSEQIPSMIALDVQLNDDGSVQHAAGFLVQAMPGADKKDLELVQNQILTLPNLGSLMERGLYIDDIMVNVMGDVKVKEIDRTPVHFYCRCSKDRFKDSLAMLDVSELADMKSEDQELVCQYCNEKYIITKDEIDAMHTEALAKTN